MIQIQEKDALWRFYKRYYPNHAIPPEPGNLCNYFWKAMGGAFKAFFYDTNIFLTTGVFAGICAFLIWWQNYTGVFNHKPNGFWDVFVDVVGVVFFIVTIMGSGLCTFFAPAFRFCDYWSKRDERVVWAGAAIFFVGLMDVMLSMVFKTKDSPWSPWFLLYGLGIEVGLVAAVLVGVGVWYFFFSDNTNLGANILQYLKAIKSRACPLVKPPQSHEEAKREAQLNCGDG